MFPNAYRPDVIDIRLVVAPMGCIVSLVRPLPTVDQAGQPAEEEVARLNARPPYAFDEWDGVKEAMWRATDAVLGQWLQTVRASWGQPDFHTRYAASLPRRSQTIHALCRYLLTNKRTAPPRGAEKELLRDIAKLIDIDFPKHAEK